MRGEGGRGGDRDGGRVKRTGSGTGTGAGGKRDCADLQDLELKRGREGTLQHGPGAILEGAIGSCRQSGWLREILGPEGCPRTCFKTVTKR